MKTHIIVLLFVFAFAPQVAGQQYFFRQYTNTEGLLHSFVYDLTQDDKGYMWIGTPEGLYKFNGFDFEHFTVEDGLANDFVTKIFKDSSGNIWVGHQDGTVSLLTEDGFRILNDQSDDQGSVTDFVEHELGSIWVSTQNQGLLLINNNLNIRPVELSIGYESITRVEYIGEDKFFVGSQENLYLAQFNNEESSMDIKHRFDLFPGSKVVEIIPEADGGYIIVSQDDGLYHLSPDTIPEEYMFSSIDENPEGILDNLQGGYCDSHGRLWVYSLGNGLIQYRAGNIHQFTIVDRISTENGLVSDNVRSMFEDAEGNLWFGMFGDGLLKYVENNLKIYDYSSEEQQEGTYALAGDAGFFMIVSGNRLLKMNQSGDTVLNSYPLPVNRLVDRVNGVYLAGDGRVWLGYEQSGLFVSGPSDKLFKPVFISNDELANSVNHITGTGEYIWIGTKKGICRITRESGLLKWYTTSDGLPHNNIHQLFIDSKERVLIATLCSKIHYIDDQSHVELLAHSSLGPFTPVVSFAEDKDGNLWTGTHGTGVWRINEDTIQHYTRVSGLLSDFCYSLAVTENGEPLIGHTGGLSLIDTETSSVKTFSRLDGVISSTDFYQNAVLADPFGNVWFGTSEGLLKYSSGISKGGLTPPFLQVSAMRIDGEYFDPAEGPILLKAGQYELAVEYIGISFTNPEMVFYQTQLEGYNQSWSSPTFSRSIVYDRIGHGHYTFKIKAFNENDISSELSSGFELIIKKPVYITVWFYGIILLLLGLSFFLTLRIRERNHRLVQERLLKNLDEKTKEIIIKEEIIKERRKVERILIEAKTKAELSEKLKTSFLQNMSHEIRTPMNAIVGFSQLLKDGGITNEIRGEFIDNISTNAESLLGLIDDILDVSKLETDQLNIKQGSCNLNELIRGLESTYLENLKNIEKGEIVLSALYPTGNDIVLTTDVIRLKQILSKLLDNAVKYTEKGKITFGFKRENGSIEFFVEDTGIGLSEDKKEVIFDLFRKIEDDNLKLYGGTGLGLTLSRYLVNLMGGEINVDSKEGVGSRFFFVLPSNMDDDDSLNRPSGAKEEFKNMLVGKRILVVEDIDSNFHLVEQYLLPTGASVERASDGQEALNLFFSDGVYDLVIMDIKLPGLDGYEVTRKIREKDKTVPIISHTAFAMEGDELKSLEAGCNAYITKPTDRLLLLKTIANLIQ